MTILTEHGIFEGGVLSKQPVLGRSILISPYFLNLFNGEVSGSGDNNFTGTTKAVELSFGVSSPPSIYRDVLSPPRYKIFVGLPAGKVWIFYDEAHADIGLTETQPSGKIVFGAISWPANNGSIVTDNTSAFFNLPIDINSITIDLTERTEALVAKADSGLGATKLYYDSQRYVAGNLNRPIAETAVITEVLLAENALRAGGNYFITLLQDSQIHTDPTHSLSASNMSVILEPCRHISRAQTEFRVYNSKAQPGSAHALVKTYLLASDFQGKYIYVLLNKLTGVVSITENATIGLSDANNYVIARSTAAVAADATDLTGVNFQVLNNIISLTRVQVDAAKIPNAESPTGWLNPTSINTTGLANTIHLNKNVANILGYGIEVPSQNIVLPAPPATGTRFDMVWLEVEFTADPVLQVVGTIRQTSTTDPNIVGLETFIQHSIILNTSASPAPFIKQENGLYRASKPENTYDPYTYALPIAIVGRYNTGVFSAINGNGSVGRADNKSATIIQADEILVSAPTINRRSAKELFGKNLQFLLKGTLATKLEQGMWGSGSTNSFSKKPLQIDYLGTATIGTAVGNTNGGRRLWSHNISKMETMSFSCQSNLDSSGFVGVFNSTAGHKLTIKVPAGATDTEIAVDPMSGQPIDVSVVWAEDGQPVEVLNTWAVGPLNEVADIYLDTTASSFTAHNPGSILVMFKTKYKTQAGFSHLPETMLSASINNSTLLTDKYWLSASNSSGEKISNIGIGVVVGSSTVLPELWSAGSDSSYKFYSFAIKIPKNGNNLANTPYQIPDSFIDGADTYNFSGVVQVVDKNGFQLAIDQCKWVSNTATFEVSLSTVVPSGDPVWFVMGCTGKELVYTKGNAEISNLAESTTYNPYLAPASGVIFFSTGKIIKGFESLNNNSIVYLEDFAVPVHITGIGGNLLKIDMNISALEYATLSVNAAANYVSNGVGGYKPIAGSVVKFGYSQTREETQNVVIRYLYSASPFTVFDQSKTATVVERGFLIQTTDGSGSAANSSFGPLDLRLPTVQGVMVTGDGVSNPSPVGMTDVISYQQLNTPFLEGSEIVFDSTLALNVNTHQHQGLSAWVSLVEQDGRLLLFVYEVRDGLFVLNNASQAFTCELQDFRRVR